MTVTNTKLATEGAAIFYTVQTMLRIRDTLCCLGFPIYQREFSTPWIATAVMMHMDSMDCHDASKTRAFNFCHIRNETLPI